MLHLGSDHRSVTARNARYRASMEPREDPDSPENLQEVERRYDELEKRLTGKHEAAAHEESEILDRKHTMTTTVTMRRKYLKHDDGVSGE